MRFLRPSLVVLFSLMVVSAFTNSARAVQIPYKESPSLETEKDRVHFFVRFRTIFPQLFKRKLDYKFDLLRLLEDQNRLAKLLMRVPQYEQAFRELKSNSYLELEIRAKSDDKPRYDIRIKPQTFLTWKSSLDETLVQLERDFPPDTRFVEAVTRVLSANQEELENSAQSAALLSSLDILAIASNKLRPLPEGFKARKALEKIRFLREEGKLPEQIGRLNKFIDQGGLENLGFEKDKDYTSADLLELLERHAALLTRKEFLESSFNNLVELSAALLSGDEPGNQLETISEMRNSLDGLESSTLTELTNLELVKGRVEKLGNFKFGPATDYTWKRAKASARDTERMASDGKKGLRLLEVPPVISVLRAMAGDDCSSRFSFPFPNHPAERVFFVIDGETDFIKGYVSTRTVILRRGNLEKRALYVHTLQGVHLSDLNLRNILQGLYMKRTELGVDEIVLPTRANIYAYHNFESIRQTLYSIIEGQPSESITYLYPDLSRQIEEFESSYNTRNPVLNFDHMARNTEAILVKPTDLESFEYSLKVSQTFDLSSAVSADVLQAHLVDIISDLQSNNRSDELTPFLRVAQIPSEVWQEWVSTLGNPNQVPVSEFLTEIRKLSQLVFFDPDYAIKHRKELIANGFIRAPDAVSKANLSLLSGFLAKMIEGNVALTDVNRLLLKDPELLLSVDAKAVKKYPHLVSLGKLANKGKEDDLKKFGRILSKTGRNPFGRVTFSQVSSSNPEIAESAQRVITDIGDDSYTAESDVLMSLITARSSTPSSQKARSQACSVFKNKPGFLGNAALALHARQNGCIPNMVREIFVQMYGISFSDKDPQFEVAPNSEIDGAIADYFQDLVEYGKAPTDLKMKLSELAERVLVQQKEKVLQLVGTKILGETQDGSPTSKNRFNDFHKAFLRDIVGQKFSAERVQLLQEFLKSPSIEHRRWGSYVLCLVLDRAKWRNPSKIVSRDTEGTEAVETLLSLLDPLVYNALLNHEDYREYQGVLGLLGFRTDSRLNIAEHERLHWAVEKFTIQALEARIGDEDALTLKLMEKALTLSPAIPVAVILNQWMKRSDTASETLILNFLQKHLEPSANPNERQGLLEEIVSAISKADKSLHRDLNIISENDFLILQEEPLNRKLGENKDLNAFESLFFQKFRNASMKISIPKKKLRLLMLSAAVGLRSDNKRIFKASVKFYKAVLKASIESKKPLLEVDQEKWLKEELTPSIELLRNGIRSFRSKLSGSNERLLVQLATQRLGLTVKHHSILVPAESTTHHQARATSDEHHGRHIIHSTRLVAEAKGVTDYSKQALFQDPQLIGLLGDLLISVSGRRLLSAPPEIISPTETQVTATSENPRYVYERWEFIRAVLPLVFNANLKRQGDGNSPWFLEMHRLVNLALNSSGGFDEKMAAFSHSTREQTCQALKHGLLQDLGGELISGMCQGLGAE